VVNGLKNFADYFLQPSAYSELGLARLVIHFLSTVLIPTP
jgi:hypothetical protein